MVKSDNESEEIVLRGKVIEVRPSKGAHPHLKWLIVLQVDSVIDGSYSGQTFSFNIHSLTKSGIVVGGQYTIHMTRTQTGEYKLNSIER
jgi:hypothetical protein